MTNLVGKRVNELPKPKKNVQPLLSDFAGIFSAVALRKKGLWVE